MRSALQSSRLRRVLTAYTVNRLGSWLGLVALSLAVFDHTHSTLAVAALLFAWQALPAFLVPSLVARVEASNRRGQLSALYFFEGVVTAALAVFVWHFWLPALLVLALLDGTAALAANSLLRAEVARVGRDEIPRGERASDRGGSEPGASEEAASQEAERSANAALNIAFTISFVAGPVIGGVVAAAAGVPAALLIDVGTFLLCGALLLDLHPHVEQAPGDTVRAALRAAWTHIRAAPRLRMLLSIDAVGLVLIQAGGPIEVALVKATLHGGDRDYGLLVTAWGAGAVLTSLVFARYSRQPLGVTLSAAILGMGLAFVGFAVAPSLALAYLAAFVGGAGNGLYVPSIISLVQRLTPYSLHGRLMGAVESLGALSLALALPLGGLLVALSSPRVAFLALGLGTLAIAPAYARAALGGFESKSRHSVGVTGAAGNAPRAADMVPIERPPE